MLSLTRLLPTPQTSSRAFSTSAALLAHKKGAGSTKNNRGSIGRRLGVKKFADELVQPGDIITRQRGMTIHAGQNVGVGRDHTLFALTPGYLKFYSMPHNSTRPSISANLPNRAPPQSSVAIPDTRRPKGYRRFVGITLRRDDTLPRDERRQGRERMWFGTLESEKHDTVWEWKEGGADGDGRFVEQKASSSDLIAQESTSAAVESEARP